MPKSSLPASLSLALQERARAYGLPPLMTRGAFFKVRDQKWKEIQDIKRTRRLQLGPFASVYFENMQTMWWQIQEMLRVENGGEDQLQDELNAFGPLVPRGDEWVFTLMFEISSPSERTTLLESLGCVENTISLHFNPEGYEKKFSLSAVPTDPEDIRTTQDGKTSAVHFLRLRFTPEQKAILFAHAPKPATPTGLSLCVSHKNYTHHTAIFFPLFQELLTDLK